MWEERSPAEEYTTEEKISPVFVGVTAAMYTAVTLALPFLAYMPQQIRISDAMLILPFHKRFGKSALIGLTIGGFFANLASPFLPWDLIVGPIANFLACFTVYILGIIARRTWGSPQDTMLPFLSIALVGSIIGSALIAVIVGYELVIMISGEFLWIEYIGFVVSVFIGELIAFTACGVALLAMIYRSFPETY